MSDRQVLYYDFDNFRLDIENQQLLKDGIPVILTHKAIQTLIILVQNFGKIVKKEDLYRELWADSFVEESNLTQYIYLLRKTLGKNDKGVSYIETFARRGYVFTAQVKKSFSLSSESENPFRAAGTKDETATVLAASIQGSSQSAKYTSGKFPRHLLDDPYFAAEPLPQKLRASVNGSLPKLERPVDDQDEKELNSRRLNRNLILLIFSIVVAAAFGFCLIAYLQKAKTSSMSKNISSIAVMPFKEIGTQSNDEKTGLGMANAIITRLSKLQEISVRPTSAVFRFADNPPPNSIVAGKELNVDAVLEGTIQRNGERVRVSVQLISIADEKPLWGDTFDETSTNMFTVQDSISVKVAQSLSLNLTKKQERLLAERETNNTDAFQACQLGIYFWNLRTNEGLHKAVDYFSQAVTLDPNYALAYAMLADTYTMLGYYHYEDRREMWIKAQPVAEKALELNDQIAEAHIAMASIMVPKDMAASKKSLERAIELAPNNSTAHLRYGWVVLDTQGDLNETVQQMRLAQENDPLSPASNNTLCTALTFQHNYTEAVKYCEKAVEISPNTPTNRLALANTYFFAGRTDEAINQAKTEAETGNEKLTAIGSLGYFYAKLGRQADAEKIVAELKPEADKDPVLYQDLTLISYALGKKDDALGYFKKAYEKKAIDYTRFKYDPPWEPVSHDEHFTEVLKRY